MTLYRRGYGQHIHVFPQPAEVYEKNWLNELNRVGGEALCRVCELPYNEHPTHPDYEHIPTLHATCDGRPVKT